MKNQIDEYWKGKWKKGARVLVTEGDWTIGEGVIISLNKKDRNWAIVKLDKIPKNYYGLNIKGKPLYVRAYKRYCYKFEK